MEGWDFWVRRVYDFGKVKLFLSGFFLKFFSREILIFFRGRVLIFEVFLLSFWEFLRFKGFEVLLRVEFSLKKFRFLNFFREYVIYGGFLEVVLVDDLRVKRFIVIDYFNIIIVFDVVEWYLLRNLEEFRVFFRLVFNLEYLSLSKMERIFKSFGYRISRLIFVNYLRYLSEFYFFFLVEVFLFKVCFRIGYFKKVYFVDNLFLMFFSVKFSENFGRFMENIVFLEFRRKGEEINYFFNENWEIDFVLFEKEIFI